MSTLVCVTDFSSSSTRGLMPKEMPFVYMPSEAKCKAPKQSKNERHAASSSRKPKQHR